MAAFPCPIFQAPTAARNVQQLVPFVTRSAVLRIARLSNFFKPTIIFGQSRTIERRELSTATSLKLW